MAQHGLSPLNGHGAAGRLTNGHSSVLLRPPPSGGGGGGSSHLYRPLSRERSPLSGSSILRERTPLFSSSILRERTTLSGSSILRERTPLSGSSGLRERTPLSVSSSLRERTPLSGSSTLRERSTLSVSSTIRERTPLSSSSSLREQSPLSGTSTLRELSGTSTLRELSGTSTIRERTPLRNTSTLREMSPRSVSLSQSVVLTSGGRRRSGGSLFQAMPAAEVSYTPSFGLSSKIDQFLKRSDHSMDAWKKLTRRRSRAAAEPPTRLGRARSSAAIVMRSMYREVSEDAGRQVRELTRDRSAGTEADDFSELDSELGELTADLSEEHHTATLATERLDAEQTERMRLEADLQSVQSEFTKTSALNERLEKELLYRRTSAELAVSGSDEDEDGDELGSATAYQRKYEYTARELAYTRQRLQTQHEDDVEQMMVLKKQLDKKVEAAYEEVDEQRQIVAQQKRKVARLTGEANDLRIHLEEQTSRNTVLEKKQRKFDIDMHALQEELRHEHKLREAATRQAEQLQRERCSLDNDVAAMRLDLEMQEEKVTALRRELDELGGSGGSEDEVAALRRSRLDLQHKCQEQEEELDDMAGQLSMLEQAKLRLEMSLEQMRKEQRREIAQKDEEVEEVRANASKKLKALEAQLETEHEERTALVREKHELERRIIMLNETTISQDDQEAILKLKRDLKRTRALLKDTQAQLEKARSETSSKVQIRQLKNQLEDAEFARGAAVKARQSLAQELQETQALLEETQRARTDTETRYLTASRELHQLQAQVDEQEEETQEVMKKYKAAVAQLSVDQLTLQDQASQLTQLEAERAALREQLAEQASRLDALQGETASAHDQRRLELRVRELESRCEFEQTTKLRLETQTTRLKEAIEKASNEADQARQREQQGADQLRKLQRQLRESKDQLSEAERKESDAVMQARSLAKELEITEGEVSQSRADLKLAFKRIADLQNAMQCELESEPSDSEAGSDTDDDLDSFLSAHMAGGAGRRTSAAASAANGASGQPLSIVTDSRSGGSESTPLSPLSLTSDPDLRPRQNGSLESDA